MKVYGNTSFNPAIIRKMSFKRFQELYMGKVKIPGNLIDIFVEMGGTLDKVKVPNLKKNLKGE